MFSLYKGIPERVLHGILIFFEGATADYAARLCGNRGFVRQARQRTPKRMIVCLAKIAAWVGDNDLACEQLVRANRLPDGVSYGELKLLPFWDPLRGEPRFEKIVVSLAPK